MTHAEMVGNYLEILNLHNCKRDFSLLQNLVARHVATFAFGNIGCQLGEELPLDFASLYQRIVVQRRGGYCFEQNGLLFEILKELDFSPQLSLARVIHNENTHPGLTHRISLVEFDKQTYVLDVGFGFDGPRIPVPLSGVDTEDGDRLFRIAECRPGEYHMQVVKDGEFYSLYRFELARYGQADCEIGHFYSHKHPAATFVNHLVVSLLHKKEIRSLLNLEYRLITSSGTLREEIDSSNQLKQILVNKLGIQVTDSESSQLFKQIKSR